MGDVQRIMHVHVPTAWNAILALTLAFVCALSFLFTNAWKWDNRLEAALEMGVVFSMLPPRTRRSSKGGGSPPPASAGDLRSADSFAQIADRAERSRALFAEARSSFRDYRLVRIGEAPRRIHVDIAESDGPPGGIGEPGVPPVAPAIANAVFALTGRRIRELPLTPRLVA